MNQRSERLPNKARLFVEEGVFIEFPRRVQTSDNSETVKEVFIREKEFKEDDDYPVMEAVISFKVHFRDENDNEEPVTSFSPPLILKIGDNERGTRKLYVYDDDGTGATYTVGDDFLTYVHGNFHGYAGYCQLIVNKLPDPNVGWGS